MKEVPSAATAHAALYSNLTTAELQRKANAYLLAVATTSPEATLQEISESYLVYDWQRPAKGVLDKALFVRATEVPTTHTLSLLSLSLSLSLSLGTLSPFLHLSLSLSDAYHTTSWSLFWLLYLLLQSSSAIQLSRLRTDSIHQSYSAAFILTDCSPSKIPPGNSSYSAQASSASNMIQPICSPSPNPVPLYRYTTAPLHAVAIHCCCAACREPASPSLLARCACWLRSSE